MTTLTRERLTESAKPRYKDCSLKDGTTYRLRSITEAEKSAYEAIVYDEKGKFQTSRLKLRRRKLIQLALVDEAGINLYSAKEVPEMVMDGGIASEIFAEALVHCGIDVGTAADDDDDEDSVTEKKDDSALTGDSGSVSASA